MCRSSTEPQGPRRCSGDTRANYQRAAETADRLERAYTALSAQTLHRTPAASFTMALPHGVESAVRTARRVGNPLIVGGAVRDAALGVTPKDVDIEVHGVDIDTLAQRYRSDGFSVDEVGRQFGVLKISKPGTLIDLDVSVPRRENKISAGHRGFAVVTDPELTVTEAAARRDFSINAMLYDPHRKLLIDPFGGLSDLHNRRLRHVSDQFGEDPLRVLRAVQLAGRFGLALDPETAAVCRRLRPHFGELAVERTREEWAKLFTKSRRPECALQVLRDSGWDDTLPGLRAAITDPEITRAFSAIPTLAPQDRMAVGAAILSSAMSAADRRQFLHHTVTGAAATRIAEDLVTTRHQRLATSYARRRYAAQMARRGFTFERYLAYSQALEDESGQREARAAVRDGLARGPLTAMIQGRDVLAVSQTARKPGKWVGTWVADALDRQHRGQFASREDALRWLATAIAAEPPPG